MPEGAKKTEYIPRINGFNTELWQVVSIELCLPQAPFRKKLKINANLMKFMFFTRKKLKKCFKKKFTPNEVNNWVVYSKRGIFIFYMFTSRTIKWEMGESG